MRCKRCGNDNPHNVNRCIYCNTPLQTNNFTRQSYEYRGKKRASRNNTDIIIISLIALLIIALISVIGLYIHSKSRENRNLFGGGGGGGGSSSAASYKPDFDNEDPNVILERIAGLNNGIMPEITYDDDGIPSFIDGTYTNLIVNDYSTAIKSLYDIKGLMKFNNPQKEYIGVETLESDGYRFYKFRQILDQVAVYAKQLIIEADPSGKVVCLSCDYDPNLSISTTPSIEKLAAERTAVEDTGTEKALGSKLYVYNINGEPSLAWAVDVGKGSVKSERVFVSAQDGSVIDYVPFRNEASIDASAADMRGDLRNIHVSRSGAGFKMADEQYGITVFEANNSENGEVVISSDNTWNNAAAVSAMANIEQTLGYYTNSLNSSAFKSNKLRKVEAYIDYKPDYCETEKYFNALSYNDDNDMSTTRIEYGGADDFVKCLDVTAHELTHSVIAATCNLQYLNQSGAINEAYADIIGNLLQNEYYGTQEWELAEELNTGALRSMSNPNAHAQPDSVGGAYMHDYCTQRHNHFAAGCDYGGVHTNSGILNKAAYLMYSGGMTNRLELASLFVRSMDYMVPTSNFVHCRAALLRAARDMGMDENKIAIIRGSLENVGIINRAQNVSDAHNTGIISGKVADAVTKTAIADAQAEAQSTVSGRYNTYTGADGVFNLNVTEGTYRITISALGYMPCRVENVNASEGETTYLENAILLTEINGNPECHAGGKVTNAVTGDPIEGAAIKFREGWGNISGDYAKNLRENEIVLTTNPEGVYYTADLPYGYYTAEAVKDGYAPQYVNIVSALNDDICTHQDILLTPHASGNEFRITLEWDENPRDEDAHIKGDYPVDFHVFYQSQNAGHNGETIANLDHDDTEGNGFETITLKADDRGTYKYYVHHYAGSGSLSTSNAKVNVIQGNDVIARFNVPTDQGEGKYWNVFNIINGEIVPVNTISDSPE